MANLKEEDITRIRHEWETLDSRFSDFHNARSSDGLWKRIVQARLPPDIIPELQEYAEGARSMSGMLADDLRILGSIHETNPTRIGANVRDSSAHNREIESAYKLSAASWWDRDLNRGRRTDRTVYQGQVGLGLNVIWMRWAKQVVGHDGKRPISGCPVKIEKTIVDACRWNGDYENPDFWLRYTTSVIDCDIKNGKGERPVYTGDALDWIVGEQFPPDYYEQNVGKEIEVIVSDRADPVAMCPLEGCYHRKRKITIYVCKKDGKPEDYEEVESYDSPLEKCSFIIVGGDIQETERDPHRIFRPTAWILIALVDEYNRTLSTLDALMRQELGDDSKYMDGSTTNPEIYNAWLANREGSSDETVKKPPRGSRDIPFLPATVKGFGSPQTDLLRLRLAEIKSEYALRRPKEALTGDMAISEVSATAATIQKQGAGITISSALGTWDANITRIFEEIRHGIRYTGHFEPADEQTKYVAMITGKEHVYGASGKPGQEVYLDAKRCDTPVQFSAYTSADTPADKKERRTEALIGFEKRILDKHDLYDAWDVFDHEEQDRRIFREDVRTFAAPLKARRIALYVAKKSALETGMDFGEAQLVANTLDDVEAGGPQQFHNTNAANYARTNPGVELAPTGDPSGGSSSLAGP